MREKPESEDGLGLRGQGIRPEKEAGADGGGRGVGAHGSRWAAAWGPPAVEQEAAGSGAGLREEGAGTTPGVLGCMGEGEAYAWGAGE